MYAHNTVIHTCTHTSNIYTQIHTYTLKYMHTLIHKFICSPITRNLPQWTKKKIKRSQPSKPATTPKAKKEDKGKGKRAKRTKEKTCV